MSYLVNKVAEEKLCKNDGEFMRSPLHLMTEICPRHLFVQFIAGSCNQITIIKHRNAESLKY